MYRLVFKPNAVRMVRKAYKWYEKQRPGLGAVFLKELDHCYDKLESIPDAYQKINNDFRQIIVKVFPYVVVFEILGEEVVIYAVFHTSRNPKRKFRK